MPRSSKVHYIAPSAISILPNANGTSSDLAVYVARGTKIKVYSPAAGIDMEDTTYQEWSLRGRNRHLAEGSKPYTIYARLSKTMKEDGYLVFAPQKKNAVSGKWGDKYSCVTTDGLSQITRNDGTKARVADPDYWYIRLGEVSLPDGNDKRTVDLDTGIVGTDQYNMDWALNPDNPELHVELDCRIDSKDAGQSPIVPLGKALVLTSLLKGKASIVDTLDHWTIERSTGDDQSDASWPDATRASSFARTGIITLAHDKEEGDDFNGTVVAVFTVRAWGRPEEAAGTRAGGTGTGTGTTEYVELASERISIMTQAGNQFLSRLVDDAAQGIITFMRGLKSVGDIIASVVKSENYTGTGLADTGYLVTDNWNDSGSSGAVFDYLTIRKRMIINSLEIKETHFSAGDLAQSCANAELARTDYYQVTVDGQGNETYTLLGYSEVRVPWVLRGIMAVRQKLFPGASKKVPSALGRWKKVRMTLTEAQLECVNRVRCYFLAKDGEKNVENWWRVNDLARCQTWNVEKSKRETFTPDFDSHVGNIYWWRKVMKVSQNTGEQRYIVKDADGEPVVYDPKDTNTYATSPNAANVWKNEVGNAHLATNGERSGGSTVPEDRKPAEIDGKTYHWFDVAYDYTKEKDGKVHEWCDAMSDIPAAGDKVVQFGNTEDPDRMNVTVSEVNGSGNVDAPDIKIYRGIYSFSMQKSWWGGKPCKMKLSPSTGYEFYGPHFRFTTEYGKARPTMDRGLWTKIGFERDEYNDNNRPDSYTGPTYSDDKNGKRSDGSAKSKVRKCYYYDRVSHKGSLWLCTMANETWYWRATETFTQDGTTYNAGDKLSDSQFTSLTDENKNKCEHVRNYTNEEPSATSLVWTKQVSQGGFKSRAFCRTNKDISNTRPTGGTASSPVPVQMTVDGETIKWFDGAPSTDASGNKNAILWSTTAWFFEGDEKPEWSLPTPETDTQTQDIEFSPNREKPAEPVGTAANKDTEEIKRQRHQQGWYDPKDTLPQGMTWEDMVWRAEHQIANGVYSGSWEISRIKGESANRLDLDNEMDMIQTSSARKITAERTVETVVHLYEGAGEVDLSNVTFGTSGDARISGGPAAAVADFSQESEGTGKKGRRLKWKFKAGQVMNETYSIHVTYKYLNVDYDGVFTVAASMGQPICQLKPGLSALPCRRDEDTNSLEAPPTLPLEVLFVDGSSSATIDTFSSGTVSYNGKTYHVRYSLSSMPTGKTAGTAWPQAGVSASSTDENVYIAVFNDGGTLLDRETVPVVKDGQHGNGISSITTQYQKSAYGTPNNPSTNPNYPTDIETWLNNSPAVDSDKPYLWVKQTIDYKYAADKVNYYCSGKMGDHGIDAKDAEWVYIRTKTAVAPVIDGDSTYVDSHTPTGYDYKKDDHLPKVKAGTGGRLDDIESNNSGNPSKLYECTDDPKGVDGTYKYEWEIKRTKGDPVKGEREWLPYSGTMTLHNNLAESALTIDIDNDTDQFGVDADGKVLVQQTCSTVVSMLYGTAEQTFIDPDDNNHPEPRIALKYDDGTPVDTSVAEASVAAVPNTANKEYRVTVTVKQTGSGVTPVFSKTGKNGLYVDISGTCSLGTKTIRFTIQKVMSGKAGENPVIYKLNPTVKCFVFNRDNNNGLTPTAISSTINALKTVGNTTSNATSADNLTFTWGFDNEAATQEHTNLAIGSSISVGSGQADDYRTVWIQLSTGDRETLPIVKDGEHGVSPWQADLSNEMDSIHVTDLGNASSYQYVYTYIMAYQGSTEKNYAINSVERYYIDGNGVRQSLHTYTSGNDEAHAGVTLNFAPASGGRRSVTVHYANGALMHGKDLYDITITPAGGTATTLTFTVVATTGDRYELIFKINSKVESAIRAERKDDNTLVVAGTDSADFTLGATYYVKYAGGGNSGPQTVGNDGAVDGGYYAMYRLRTSADSTWGSYSLLSGTVAVSSINTYDAVELVICSDTQNVEATAIERETIYVVADGRKGNDGKSVVSTNIYYTAAASQPNTPSGAPGGSGASGWVDDGNSLITSGNAAYHLYESTCTTYSDGTYSWTTPLDDGLIGDMAATEEEFALSDSGTTAPAESSSAWRTSVTPAAGKWIWSRTKLTFKNGSVSYVNTQCVGYCGTNGDAAVVYTIECADTIKPGDTALEVKVKRSEGTDIQTRTYNDAYGAWGVRLTPSMSGGGEATEAINGVTFSGTITSASVLTLTLTVGQATVATKVIRAVADGESIQGEPGHVGRWYYFAGDFVAVPDEQGRYPYYMEETQAPYVRWTQDNGQTYHYSMLDNQGVEPSSLPFQPTQAPWEAGQSQWTDVQSEFKYLISEAIFTGFAHLGSFIINGDWMISVLGYAFYSDGSDASHLINADGTISDPSIPGMAYTYFDKNHPNDNSPGRFNFCPNFAVDGHTGKVYMNDAYVRGQIFATGGEIDGQMIVGNSGSNHIKIQPMDGYGAAVEGYAGSDKNFSLGFFGGYPCLMFFGGSSGSTYGRSIAKLSDGSGSYIELNLTGGAPSVELCNKVGGVEYKISFDITPGGLARIISNCWPTSRDDVPTGGVYMDRSSGVLMVETRVK